MCGCCNETVLFFNFIIDNARRNTDYRHFFVTSILVENDQLVNIENDDLLKYFCELCKRYIYLH